MIINNHFIQEKQPLHVSYDLLALNPEDLRTLQEVVLQIEHTLMVYLEGDPTLLITCTPSHLIELAVGRMVSEGIIAHVDEIDTITLCEDGSRIDVSFCNIKRLASKAFVPTCSSTGAQPQVLNNSFEAQKHLEPVTPIDWDKSLIWNFTNLFAKGTPLHRKTTGTHSCFLAHGNEILYCCEDIGRHNALDKVLGCALIDGLNLAECALFSTGRVPADMMSKIIRSRVPIFISKSVPTDKAIELARTYNVTLVSSAWPDQCIICNDPSATC